MKDMVGNEVAFGDEVLIVIPSYSELAKGKIVKLTPKGVTVEYYNSVYDSLRKTSRMARQFVKVVVE